MNVLEGEIKMNNVLSPKEAMRIEDEIIVEILKLRELISNAYSATENYPFPSMDNLRKATERDIVAGNVIWYPKTKWYEGDWQIVEVLDGDTIS